MRHYVTGLAVLLLVMALGACGGRDLSTPAARMVGHWRADVALVDLRVDAYLGAPGEDGLGTLTITSDEQDMSGSGTYRVLSEDAEGERLTALFTIGGGGQDVTVGVPRDGKTIKVRLPASGAIAEAVGPQVSLTLDYVDGETAP